MKSLLILTTIFLACSSTMSSKTQQEEKSLLKALLSSLKDPELNKERMFAKALLAKESTANSLTLLGSDYQSLDQSPASSSSPNERRGGRRTRRSIGFLTRLGACVMTFFSNPTCWTRLTRGQIQREQNRQLELQQQEQQRRYLEQKIYQGYLNTLLGQPSSSSSSSLSNGTNPDGSSSSNRTTTSVVDGNSLLSSSSSITLPLLNLSTMSLLTPTTTQKPSLFPMSRRIMSRFFPRLYSFMSQAMHPQPGYVTGSSISSSSSIFSHEPRQYTRNIF